jgi:hypothetical protein
MKIGLILVMLSLPLFVAISGPAQDESVGTGLFLQEMCNGGKGDFGEGYCYGITKGVLFAAYNGHLVCLPEAATAGQEHQVLVKYLNDHPERLHEN